MSTAPTSLPRRHLPHTLGVAVVGTLLAAALAAGVVSLTRHDGLSFGSSTTLRGSGISATQARALPAFTAIDLSGGNDVAVRVGGAQSVVVRGDDNLLRYVTTGVRGGELRIGQSRSFSTSSPMHVEITVPSLDSLALSGAGMLGVRGMRGSHLSVRVPGSGVVSVSGSVDRLEVSLAGSGDVRLEQLAARDARASVAGSGRIQVDATQSLDASIAGSGAIYYSGNPAQVSRSVTGSGAIVPQ